MILDLVYFPHLRMSQISFISFILLLIFWCFLFVHFYFSFTPCREAVRMFPPSWSLIKWLIRVFVGLAFQAELPSNPSLSSS